jgi:endoglucanase
MRTIAIILAALLIASAAEAIELKRGLNIEPWTTWPDEAGWSAPGFLDVFPEWRKVAGPAELQHIKAAGFDFVRFGVDPTVFLWKPNAKRSQKLIAEIAKRLDEFDAAGLKVIVDLHIVPTGGHRKIGTETVLKNDAAFAKYLKAVDEIGRAIAHRDPGKVAFQPFNEPTIDCGGKPRWPKVAKALHAAARKSAPRLTLIMQGACWGSADGLAKLDPAAFADDNLLWSFHSYEPFIVTHQGASWTEDVVRYVSGLRYPPAIVPEVERRRVAEEAKARIRTAKLGKAREKRLIADLNDNLASYFKPGGAEAALAQPFDAVAAWAKRHNVPPQRILLGEFGAIRQDEAAVLASDVRASIVSGLREAAESRGFGWAVWSWGGSFSLTGGSVDGAFDPLLLRALGLSNK